jgi:VWFA-related protein
MVRARTSSRGRALLVSASLLLAAPLAAWVAPEPPPPEASFESAIDVSLRTMVVRVVDTWGNPVLGLQPQDFRVRVGPHEVPVTALDWISADEPQVGEDDEQRDVEAATSESPSARVDGTALNAAHVDAPPLAPPTGRLVVLFVQADLTPVRISGQMRLRPYTRELLATLHPRDRVAVVSFDSHLKLWQDFGSDLEATLSSVDEAMLFSPERAVDPASPPAPSLAARFDLAAARQAASPERALELVARALAPLPGEKTLLFLGWGMGRFDRDGVRMAPGFAPAVRALRDAHAAVFVLDTTSADSHSLAAGLEQVAEATGGAYFSTFRLPQIATRTLARTLSGYYVLTLDEAAVGEGQGRVRVELRGKSGTVLARPLGL